MLVAYHFGSLSTLQPINSISFVISAILGFFVLHEPITMGKITGILLIMVGVFQLAKGEST